MADDHDSPHAEQRRAALLRVVEKLEQLRRFGPAQHVGERLLHHPHEHAARRLVEFEDHVPDKAVAHDHVDPPLLALPRQDVPALDVADVVDPRGLLEELVCFLHDRIPLLVFFADVEQAHPRTRLVQHVAHVHRPEVREADELARVAVHVGAAVEHQDGVHGRRKQRADRGALHPFVQPQHQGRGRHHGAGVARRDERIARPLLLEADPDGDGGAGLALDGGQGLLAHAHHLGCLDDLEAVAVDGAVRLERGLDVAGPPHELDPERGREFAQGLHRALDLHSRRVVPAHGIQRDADHR